MNLFEIKYRAVSDALRRHEGNRTRAAKELGISVRTMRIFIRNGVALGIEMTPVRKTITAQPKPEFIPDKRMKDKVYCRSCGIEKRKFFKCKNCISKFSKENQPKTGLE